MVKCPKCSSENKSDSKFCYNCGAELKDSVEVKSDDSSDVVVASEDSSDVVVKSVDSSDVVVGSEDSSDVVVKSADSSNVDSKSRNPFNLDGKSRPYGSTTGKSAGSHSAYYDHSASSGKGASGSGKGASISGIKGINENFQKMGPIQKLLTFCCLAFIILFIISFIVQGLGLDMEIYREDHNPFHDYTSIDLDEDGALSFEELQIEYSNVSRSSLKNIFENSDRNGNGLIKGSEYDKAYYLINDYFKDLEKSKNNKKSSSNSSSSSSSSYSSNHKSSHRSSGSSDGGETCPYCGSEAIYSSGNSYVCAECGRTIYNPDDLDLNYDEGYMYLLVPITTIS